MVDASDNMSGRFGVGGQEAEVVRDGSEAGDVGVDRDGAMAGADLSRALRTGGEVPVGRGFPVFEEAFGQFDAVGIDFALERRGGLGEVGDLSGADIGEAYRCVGEDGVGGSFGDVDDVAGTDGEALAVGETAGWEFF